jgi:CubicO group peptidase (beta-lactamase class C family)
MRISTEKMHEFNASKGSPAPFLPNFFNRMKRLAWILTIIITGGWNCNTSSGSKQHVAVEDSLEYYPPTPAPLSKQKFRQHYREISNFFETRLIRKGFNGSIVVAIDGAIVYEKYNGFEDLRTKATALTDSSALHIASTSKTITGVAVLRLAQENKLSLEDSIQKFFPGLPYSGVTVQTLLNHRSGLPNYVYFIPNSKKWDKKKYVTNDDVLTILYNEKPARSFAPNRNFSYSNTNYVLLAMIIEKVTGMKYSDYLQQQFFDPLGMKHTYVYSPADSARAIASFTGSGKFWENDFLDHTYGDKNIYSTPRDLLKWDQAFYTDQILSQAMMDSAFKAYSNERPSKHNYGLGWRLLTLSPQKKVIYHNGRWHGFNSAFARLTDEKVSIIILGNKYNSNIYTTARKAYDLFGNYLQEDDEEEEAPTFQAKKSTRKTKK